MENMNAETSAIQPSTDNGNGKPLYSLIKSLVSANSDSHIKVENSQLLDILRLEFNMPLHSQTDLDVDIYMNVLKNFIKTWHRWDEFDKLMKDKSNDVEVQEQLTLEEYEKLKEHLRRVLDFTQTQMKPILDKMETKRAKTKLEKPTTTDGTELTMEVACSRDQLNCLFYRKPHPQTLTIFNISEEPTATKISLSEIKFKDIINWPYMKIVVLLPNFEFVRRNVSHFDRTLINRKLKKVEPAVKTLPNNLYVRTGTLGRGKKQFRKNIIVSYLVQLIKYIKELDIRVEDRRDNLIDLFSELKNDLLLMTNLMGVSCDYQYYLSKYPYVRYLSSTDYSEEFVSGSVEKMKESINPNDFDLALEEQISPAICYQMVKFGVTYTEDKSGRLFDINYPCFQESTSNWLRFECTWCDYKCDGFLAIYHIMQHMNSQHTSELLDWQCSKCNKTFTMLHLTSNRWQHRCL